MASWISGGKQHYQVFIELWTQKCNYKEIDSFQVTIEKCFDVFKSLFKDELFCSWVFLFQKVTCSVHEYF
jgi:hypothetical protein